MIMQYSKFTNLMQINIKIVLKLVQNNPQNYLKSVHRTGEKNFSKLTKNNRQNCLKTVPKQSQN